MRLDSAIEALATRQHALVAVFQLYGLGAAAEEVRRLSTPGHGWTALTPRVLARSGSPDDADRRLMAAVLDASPGAVLAGTSAAGMWGAPGFSLGRLHVMRHRGVSRRRSPLAHVHEVIDLRPHHVKLVRGIPVTSPARTAFDLARLVHPGRVERFIDWCWAERLLDGTALCRTVTELAKRGRTGSTLLRELADARGAGYVPPASSLEQRFQQLMASAGLAVFERQVDLGAEDWVGRVDFRDRQLPLAVEIQSERYHTALVDRRADELRRRRLAEAGITVVEVWDTEVWHDADAVTRRVWATRHALLVQRRSAS